MQRLQEFYASATNFRVLVKPSGYVTQVVGRNNDSVECDF